MGAAASGEAVRRVVEAGGIDICLVGDSSPFRPPHWAGTKRSLKPILRSGPAIIPYLLVSFVLPRIGALLHGRRLRALCRARAIPFRQIDDINAPETWSALQAAGAEALVLYHLDQILSAATIDAFEGRVINVHPSLLPAHRGPVPTIHLLLDETPKGGVTIHRVTPAIDEGGVLLQTEIPLPPGVSAIGAARFLHLAAAPLLPQAVARLAQDDPGDPPGPRQPYCGFPAPALLARLRRLGRRLVAWPDLKHAWRAPI